MVSAWDSVLSIRRIIDEKQFAAFAKFKTRSDFVRSLTTIGTPDLSDELAQSYFVMLKLSLTFSAMDVLRDVIPGKFSIVDANVSKALFDGYFDKLLDACQDAMPEKYKSKDVIRERHYLRPELSNPDLARFIEDCRNLFFHGRFSPTEAALTRAPKRRALLLGLSDNALEQMDMGVIRWVDKQKRMVQKRQ